MLIYWGCYYCGHNRPQRSTLTPGCAGICFSALCCEMDIQLFWLIEDGQMSDVWLIQDSVNRLAWLMRTPLFHSSLYTTQIWETPMCTHRTKIFKRQQSRMFGLSHTGWTRGSQKLYYSTSSTLPKFIELIVGTQMSLKSELCLISQSLNFNCLLPTSGPKSHKSDNNHVSKY
mgnify:CR=1 FL=1